MSQRQIKGVIAIAVCLAVIPFFRFINPASTEWQGPMFSTAGRNKVAVEIISQQGLSGVYFMEKGSTLQDLLQRMDANRNIRDNFPLQNAMTLRMTDRANSQNVILGKMAAAQRLALGLPLDINLATHDDLLLIPGVGEAMAEKIISRRNDIGRFSKLEQLMEISGIKEKKLSKLSPYLCVEQ